MEMRCIWNPAVWTIMDGRELTKNEFKILYYLFKNGGKICSRGDMMSICGTISYMWMTML